MDKQEYLTKKEFIVEAGLTVPTLNRWLLKGTFKAAALDDKGKPLFSRAQIADAKAKHRPDLDGNKNKGKTSDASSVRGTLFNDTTPATTNANVDSNEAQDAHNEKETISQPVAMHAEKAKENLATHTADGYQGCQKSDKAVIDTKKEVAKLAGDNVREDNAVVEVPEPSLPTVEVLPSLTEPAKEEILVEVLPPETASDVITLEERANRIRKLSADVARGIIEIGRELIAAKEQVGHGNWANWLKENFDWKERAARNFMAIANRFGNRQTFADLKPSTLITLLSLPEGEEKSFIEAQTDKGRPIEELSAREVQAAVKDWKAQKEPATDTGKKEVSGETFQLVDFGRGNPLIVDADAQIDSDTASTSQPTEPLKKLPPLANRRDGANYEWYTPPEYCAAVRQVLGSVDLDPTSCEMANQNVGAAKYFTADDDALNQEWGGRVYMNPPFTYPLVERLVDKFVSEYKSGNITAGIVLSRNATETRWFIELVKASGAILFTDHRINFLDNGVEVKGSSQQGQCFFYFGSDVDKFLEVFGQIGWGVKSSFLQGNPLRKEDADQ